MVVGLPTGVFVFLSEIWFHQFDTRASLAGFCGFISLVFITGGRWNGLAFEICMGYPSNFDLDYAQVHRCLV